MKLRVILASIAAAAFAACAAAAPSDDAILEMSQAFAQGNRARLTQLLPTVRGHLLEPWAAYWELRARLDTASPQEVQDFFQRYAGTYQEDRLRNDWLLLLGRRRDWDGFAKAYSGYRMNDDREVRCYALLTQSLREGDKAPASLAEEVKSQWFALRDADDGCTLAASRVITESDGRGKLVQLDAWRKARASIEADRPAAAAAAVEIVAPGIAKQVHDLHAKPSKFLTSRATTASRARRELVALALVRLATTEPDTAARLLQTKWGPQLSAEERDWVWGVMGRQAAIRLSGDSLDYYAKVTRDSNLTDDMLAWKARAALRAGSTPKWDVLLKAINAMSPQAQLDRAWVYWRARALMATADDDAERAKARRLLEAIASPRGFYEQLAMEELGQRVTVPQRPAPLTDQEKDAARRNPGLNRALYAIALGLRAEGVREWNYTTSLHTPGGMGERQLLAAAQYACDREVWDRCINTSERTKTEFDVDQRFPMPFRDALVKRSRDTGIDPAYVYGLIRQESRFASDARSNVGASGLMQVMPATARWTARKLGLPIRIPEQLHDRETNLAIGTGYLKLVLDDFGGSMALAAAAYNAGPNRSRAWRNGPVMEAAAWTETVPFGETRDYVKKVLANATFYAALLTGQPQSLKARLGLIGPRDASQPENNELP